MDRYEHARAIIRAHEEDRWQNWLRLQSAYYRRYPPKPIPVPVVEEWPALPYRVAIQASLFEL